MKLRYIIILFILVIIYACTMLKYSDRHKVKQVDSIQYYEPMFNPKGR